MPNQRNLPECDIKSIIERIFQTRQITKADQARFMSAMLAKSNLNDAERRQVEKIFDSLRSGRVKVVD